MLLCELLALSDHGPDAGTCYLCGQDTTRGHAEPPSDNFTAWPDVYPGTVLCERCRPILHERRNRMFSWVATTAGRAYQDADNRTLIWRALVAPPEPPFAIYATLGGQKQGWMCLQRYVSTSQDRFWVGTDLAPRPLLFHRDWVASAAPLVDRMRQRGIPKQALRSGWFLAPTWQRAMTEGWQSDIDACQAAAGDLRWDIVCMMSPTYEKGPA